MVKLFLIVSIFFIELNSNCLYSQAVSTKSENKNLKDSLYSKSNQLNTKDSAVGVIPQSPPTVLSVSNSESNNMDAGLGDYIILKVENLKQLVDSAKRNEKNIILFLDNRPIKELYPDFIDTDSNRIKFYLSRKIAALDAWDPIFRKPNPLQVHKKIPISIGLENGLPIKTKVKESNSFPIIIIRPLRSVFAALFLFLVLISIYYLSKHKGMLCETIPEFAKPNKVPYSLAYCQMAFWFTIIIVIYLILFLILNEAPRLNPSVLVLLGISSGTAIGARFLNNTTKNSNIENLNKFNAELKTLEKRIIEIEQLETQSPQPVNITQLLKEKEEKRTRSNEISIIKSQTNYSYTPKESKGLIMDLLTEEDGSIAFNRFQIVVWTVVLGFIFIYNSWKDLSMPDLDNTLLGLMGISSGAYLGFKLPEKNN